jgi:hypothetical protein
MTKISTLAAVLAAIVATAASAADIDWSSPDIFTVDADEIPELLPPGTWCRILSVRNNHGEPRTLVFRRGIDCCPEDRVVIEKETGPPALGR